VLDNIVQQGTGTLGAEEDIAFHRTIAEATGNRFFAETLAALKGQIVVGVNINRNLSLIQPRDEAGARAAMRQHIENARKRVFEGG
jgi:GntR family transcriptional repressor for pyruvate dehydrogenase complex